MESKAAIMDRLRKSGQWTEVASRKDQRISELRKGGMRRQEAQDQAWSELAEKYPPVVQEGENVKLDPLDPAVNELPNSSLESFLGDSLWVFNTIGRAECYAKDAPSAGAWALLRWANRNEDDFFKLVMPKFLAMAIKVAETSESEEVEVDQDWGEIEDIDWTS